MMTDKAIAHREPRTIPSSTLQPLGIHGMASPNATGASTCELIARKAYTPKEINMTDEQKAHDKAVRAKNTAELKAARAIVQEFTKTKAFTKLPEDVQQAIERVGGKTSTRAATPVFRDKLATLFPNVGDAVSELDLFKDTKMGRGEMRKRVRETLKKSAPEGRYWVEFAEATEEWVLLHVGPEQPEGWLGKAID